MYKVLLLAIGVTLASCAPNHLKAAIAVDKAVVVSPVEPVVAVKPPVVAIEAEKPVVAVQPAASLWGSFSASAGAAPGVAVVPSGGGVEAQGVAVAKPAVYSGPTFFDRIFNIPISILHSVNDHLNTRGTVRKGVVVTAGGAAKPPVVYTDGSAVAGASASATASAEAGAGAGTLVKSADQGPAIGGAAVVGVQKPPGYYDSVFSIPITALKSVNQLLNG